jgi:hypothetical protein
MGSEIMTEILKPKSPWRVRRCFLITLAVIATLIAIFYTEEDWRGKHDWNSYKREWEVKGEKFDWQAFVPPAVPDDQNFFTSQIFSNIVKEKITLERIGQGVAEPNVKAAYWAGGNMTDLAGWQAYYRNLKNANSPRGFPIAPQPQTPAADVLLALSKYDSAVEELRQAAQQPYANIPLNYEDGFSSASTLLPTLAALKRCSSLLEFRAVAELANGQSNKAFDDVMLLFRLNDTIRSQPFLITHLVRIAILQITLQPIWEGLVRHAWTDDQLAQINAELGKLDFLADYEFTMRGERAFAIQSFENQRITRKSETLDDAGRTNVIHYYFMPAAWFYQNELNFARLNQQWALPLVDIQNRVISPKGLRRADDAIDAQTKHYSPYKILALRQYPVLVASVRRFTFAQASVDLARVACALERYRLAHGTYPETLDVLAQYLADIPHDIINGQPLHYHPVSDGSFLLYSVGWNETDDGGQIAYTKNGSVDRDKGDWVWPTTAK